MKWRTFFASVCLCCRLHTPAEEEFRRCDVLKPQTHLYRSWHICQPAAHWRSTGVLYLLRFPKRITRPHWTSGGQWHWFGASALLQRDYFDIRQKMKRWETERPVAQVRLVWCEDACMRCSSDWNVEGIMRHVVQRLIILRIKLDSYPFFRDHSSFSLPVRAARFTGIVHPKMKILPLFIPPHDHK